MAPTDEPDTAIFILSPVGPGFMHTQDSVQIDADCGCRCWVAPTVHEAIRNPFVRSSSICMRHLVDSSKAIEALREQGVPYMLPGQRAEMNRELGVAEVDQMMAHWGIVERDVTRTGDGDG